MKTEIEKLFKNFNTAPFLFVGAGLTRRYYNLPGWEELLKIFAKKVKNDDFAYTQYELEATKLNPELGILPKIAEFIENDFNKKWFKEPDFRNLDEDYLDMVKNGTSPFKAEIAYYIKQNSIIDERYKKEIELFRKISEKSISGIITTNYDTFLEENSDNYNTYIGQEELVFSNLQGVAEIYKIHGCLTNPKSIIINENDYLDFNNKCDYLAAKLMTIFLEYPIIFIGYSLNDKNIRKILESICNCLSNDNIKKLQNRFIFIEREKESDKIEVSPYSITFGNSTNEKTLTMSKIKIKDYGILYDILSTKKSKIPMRILRLFKNEFYNFVLTNEPTARMRVNLPDDKNIDDQEFAIAFGKASDFGLKGLKGLQSFEWYRNIILNDIEFNADELLEYAYPSMIGKLNKLPVNKLLYEATQVFPKVEKFANDNTFDNIISKTIQSNRDSITLPERSIKEIWDNESYNIEKKTRLMAYLYEYEINIDELENILREILCAPENKLESGKDNEKSNIRRLIRIYDYLKYYDLWKAKKASTN